MQLALNFRGELGKVSQYLVDELDQILAVLNASWNETLGDDDTLNDGTVTTRHIVAGSVTAEKLSFVPAGTSNVVGMINASTEGIRIAGAKIQIDGDVTFSSGYNPTTKVAAGGAAADVNANATTISGGKITAGTISASQLQTDLAIANKIRSTGATGLDSGSGFWLDATGTPTFRVGTPGGSYVRWDGSNLNIYGSGYSLTDANGLRFMNANDYGSFRNMVSWDSGALIGANNSSTWITGPNGGSGMHINFYGSVISMMTGSTELVKVWSDGKVGLYNGAQLFLSPGSTTSGDWPLVWSSSDSKVRYKSNVKSTGDLSIAAADGSHHHFRFAGGILEDYWVD